MRKKYNFFNYITLIGSITFVILFLRSFFIGGELKIKGDPEFDLIRNNNYYLSNINVNFVNSVSEVYTPKGIRPMSKWGYFREFLKEKIVLNDIPKHWRYLSSKRISILGDNVSIIKINWNYKNPKQTEKWFIESKPELFEFWENDFYDTWEGGMAEYLFIINQKLNYILSSKEARTWQIREIIKIAGVVSEHKKFIDWRIGDSPRGIKEKEYLIKSSEEIFGYLYQKIYSYIPIYDSGVFWYSFESVLENNDSGIFDVWISADWLKSGEKAKVVVFYDDGIEKKIKDIELTDKYGIRAGEILVDSSRDGLFFSLYSLKFKEGIENPPRVWLRKKSNLIDNPQKDLLKIKKGEYKLLLKGYTLEEEKQILSKIDINWKNVQKKLTGQNTVEITFKDTLPIIFLILSIVFIGLFSINRFLISDFTNKKEKLFSSFRILNTSLLFLIKNNYLIILIFFSFIFSVIGKNWDMLTVSSFLFWTITIFVLNIPSGFSYLLALFFILPGPYLVLVEKIAFSESLAVFSYFFIFSGVLKQFQENKNNQKEIKIGLKQLLKSNLKNIINFFIIVLIMFIIYYFISDIYLYKQFFGKVFYGQMMLKNWLKLGLIWLVVVPVLLILNRIFIRRFFSFFMLTKSNNFQNKIFFVFLLSFLLYFQNKTLSSGRKFFWDKPYILNVSPSSAKIGEEVKLIGKNFNELSPSITGKVLLDNIKQKVNTWENEEIVMEITDEYSNTGTIQIIINKDGKILESNKVDFTFIDPTKDWTEMDDL